MALSISEHTTVIPSMTMACAAVFNQTQYSPGPKTPYSPDLTTALHFTLQETNHTWKEQVLKTLRNSNRMQRAAARYPQKESQKCLQY